MSCFFGFTERATALDWAPLVADLAGRGRPPVAGFQAVRLAAWMTSTRRRRRGRSLRAATARHPGAGGAGEEVPEERPGVPRRYRAGLRRVVKAAARDYPGLGAQEMVAWATALWREPVHERRAAAVEVLRRPPHR